MEQHPDPLAASSRQLMASFRRFKRMMRKPAASREGRSGEMAVMGVVAFHQVETGEGIRITEIANLLKIAPPTVTQFINGLEKAGWVERRMAPQDRRSVLVFLTDEGKRQHEAFEAHMDEMFRKLATHLGAEDTEHLVRLLDKVFVYFEDHMKSHADGCPESRGAPGIPGESGTPGDSGTAGGSGTSREGRRGASSARNPARPPHDASVRRCRI